MKVLFVLALALIPLANACKKKEPVVPAQPDVNAQGEYFNCYIDGLYWTYKQEPYSNNDALEARQGQITLPGFKIQAESNVMLQTIVTLWMVLDSFPPRDTVVLTTYSNLAYATVFSRSPSGSGYEVTTNDTLSGQLIFTKRTSERLEGTFYFDGIRSDSHQVVRITNGRFSIIP